MYVIMIGTAEEIKRYRRMLERDRRIVIRNMSEPHPDKKWENHFYVTANIYKNTKKHTEEAYVQSNRNR